MPSPLLAAAIPAVSSAVGQMWANRQNVGLGREQMRFQERMSSTAWQRAVTDMKLAGINPMLAFSQGPASSPGGAMPRVDDPLGPAVASAQHARRLEQEMKTMRAAEHSGEATAQNQSAQSQYWHGMKERVDAENLHGLPVATARQALARARTTELMIPGLENIARIEGGDVGQKGAWIKYLMDRLPMPRINLGGSTRSVEHTHRRVP